MLRPDQNILDGSRKPLLSPAKVSSSVVQAPKLKVIHSPQAPLHIKNPDLVELPKVAEEVYLPKPKIEIERPPLPVIEAEKKVYEQPKPKEVLIVEEPMGLFSKISDKLGSAFSNVAEGIGKTVAKKAFGDSKGSSIANKVYNTALPGLGGKTFKETIASDASKMIETGVKTSLAFAAAAPLVGQVGIVKAFSPIVSNVAKNALVGAGSGGTVSTPMEATPGNVQKGDAATLGLAAIAGFFLLR